ncbi:unnamed protein product [Allacma fusca]|uniref:Uncharacterized protein n=1 Tax=Allacma fusca TaxID=39272 RepID=A0A8J2P948_9HEXA|nr:unnamed protein product [Allacma fusca]
MNTKEHWPMSCSSRVMTPGGVDVETSTEAFFSDLVADCETWIPTVWMNLQTMSWRPELLSQTDTDWKVSVGVQFRAGGWSYYGLRYWGLGSFEVNSRICI